MRGLLVIVLVAIVFLGATTVPTAAQDTATEVPPSPVGRCINMGNGLEAPSEGAWGYIIEEAHFDAIAEAGFDSVRIPVRWSAYAQEEFPYTIDADWMARVTEVVDQALARDLTVVLNVHHYDAMIADPDGQAERLIFIWTQIAEQFIDYPDTLIYEVFNEPNTTLDSQKWNQLQPVMVASIRAVDADRTLVVGGSQWMSIGGLLEMELPNDNNLIATVHYYEPFQFTHQGAEWVDGAGAWLGTAWGSDSDVQNLNADLDIIAQWRDDNGVPIFIGEFGAYATADDDDRGAWTAAVTRGAEDRGLGWCYWEFGSGFGAYIPAARIWRPFLLDALIPQDE